MCFYALPSRPAAHTVRNARRPSRKDHFHESTVEMVFASFAWRFSHAVRAPDIRAAGLEGGTTPHRHMQGSWTASKGHKYPPKRFCSQTPRRRYACPQEPCIPAHKWHPVHRPPRQGDLRRRAMPGAIAIMPAPGYRATLCLPSPKRRFPMPRAVFPGPARASTAAQHPHRGNSRRRGNPVQRQCGAARPRRA